MNLELFNAGELARESRTSAVAKPAPAPAPAPVSTASDEDGEGSYATFKEARNAYCAENPLDAPENGGECPGCKHDGCYGRLPGTTDRAFCFSENHEADSGGVGLRTERGYVMDSLDLAAHEARMTPRELLARDGYLDAAAAFDALPNTEANGGQPIGTSPEEVLDRIKAAGPRLHLSTGFAALDQATGGGLPTGIPVGLMGAPDSGKTAFGNQLVDTLSRRGIACGVISADEIDVDQLTRTLQRAGFSRELVESADPVAIEVMRPHVAKQLLRYYPPNVTIEQAAADLRAFQQSCNAPAAVLFVDSIQTVRCKASATAAGRYEQITANVAAMRDAAMRHALLVIFASEKNRGGYAHPDKRVDDMAAGSGSSAIEYGSRLLLSTDPVPGSPDHVELRIVKNKFGPRTRADEQGIVLKLDRARQTLTEVAGVVVPDRAAVKQSARQRLSLGDAALLAITLLETPGLSAAKAERQTRKAKDARKQGGLGHAAFEVARGALGDALVDEGTATGSKLRLDAAKLAPEVLAVIDQLGRGSLIDAGSRAKITATTFDAIDALATPVSGAVEAPPPTSPKLPRGELGEVEVAGSPNLPDLPEKLPGEVGMAGVRRPSPASLEGSGEGTPRPGAAHAASTPPVGEAVPPSAPTFPDGSEPPRGEVDTADEIEAALRDLLGGTGASNSDGGAAAP